MRMIDEPTGWIEEVDKAGDGASVVDAGSGVEGGAEVEGGVGVAGGAVVDAV